MSVPSSSVVGSGREGTREAGMEFEVSSEAFAEAVAWGSRALPQRPAVPVLAGMRLEAVRGDPGTLWLSCFDYEVSARAELPLDRCVPGAVLVPGRLLAEITRSLPAQPVRFRLDGIRAHLDCGSAKFTLPVLPLEDYPRLPDLPEVAGSVAGQALAGAVRQVAPAASRDDTLPMLTGVHIALAPDGLTLVATDRYRIAVREVWWHPNDPATAASALVPARTLSEAMRGITAGSNVDLALSEAAENGRGMFGVDAGGRQLTTRLIDSEFVSYRQRFPQEFAAQGELDTATLVDAVKRVALVAERSAPVRLRFTGDHLGLSVGDGHDAQAVESMDADYDGEEMTVAFSVNFLLDGLAAVETDTVRIGLTTPTKPAVIEEVPASEDPARFKYLVMPLRT